MSAPRILGVVGARPNFMKMAPVVRSLGARGIPLRLVHTGQHYDDNMSRVFFDELSLPRPDVHLEIGSGSHAEQTAKALVALERVCVEEPPDLVVVVGDVNSTLAAALVAAKRNVPLAHVEAGLRSFDPAMPEEINRIVVDRLSALLLTPSADADANLLREGVPVERIHCVGNVMIDSLVTHLERAEESRVLETQALAPRGYAVLTLHRPSNVDDPAALRRILGAIRSISEELPIVFSCHPRTAARLEQASAAPGGDVRVVPPLGYLDFLRLTSQSRLVLTDSGGLQEEATWLGIPCVTLRENTERPVTIDQGTNVLAGSDPVRIRDAVRAALGRPPARRVPPLWDGRAAERIADVVQAWWAAATPRRSGSPAAVLADRFEA